MVTAAQIATYLDDVKESQSIYLDKLVRREKIGRPSIFSNRAIAAVLNCYVNIITDYFSQATYSGGFFNDDYNFYDAEEAKEVIFRINKICDTNYYLDI